MMDMTHENVIIELHACLLKVHETTVFYTFRGQKWQSDSKKGVCLILESFRGPWLLHLGLQANVAA